MDGNSSKILKVLLLIIFAFFISAALPVVYYGNVTDTATADGQSQPSDGGVTEVQLIQPQTVVYSGNAYVPDGEYYTITKIENVDGELVENAVDAGGYTVYVTPSENCVWAGEGGAAEKSYALTIEKAALQWYYPDNTADNLLENPHTEVKYSEQRRNLIDNVWAYGAQGTEYNNKQRSNFVIIKDGNEDSPITKNVIDAGTYTFTVTDAQNYTNPTFTLIITPIEVDIGKHVNLQWVTDTATPRGLASGNIYSYNYNVRGSEETQEAYTMLKTEKSPFANWENWSANGENDTYAANAIVAFREDAVCKIKLNRDSGTMAYFKAEYGGVTAADKSGKYTAEAVISPVANYIMTYSSDSALNMTVIPLADGSYKITKTWYLVHYINEFLAETSAQTQTKEEYIFPSGWTFGQFPEGGISAPCLAHGDEIRMKNMLDGGYVQPDGYTLDADGVRVLEISGDTVVYAEGAEDWATGANDLVTFTIMCGDATVCVNRPRSELAYYVNAYMPVGSYSITFRAKRVSLGGSHNEWWNGMAGMDCGSEYLAITAEFGFQVSAAALDYDDSALNFYLNQTAAPFEVNIASLASNFNAFFGVTDGKITFNAVTNRDAAASETYWATVADSYFGAAPVLKFRLDGVGGDQYYYKTAPEWSEWIDKTGSYTVYYLVSLPNYESVPSGEDANTKYFTVNVYEEIELPVLKMSKLQWTGQARAVEATVSDYRYVLTGNVQTDLGEYEAVFTLTDAVRYRWKGAEGAVYKVEWSIVNKPANSWASGSPEIVGWKWSGFDTAVNTIRAAATDGFPVFAVTYDAEGMQFADGLENFTADGLGRVSAEIGALLNALPAGEYYLWAAVAETEDFAELSPAPYAFGVELAENVWTVAPAVSGWKVGETPVIPSAETAQSLYGTPNFKIVSEADGQDVYYDTVSSIDRISAMAAGRYILVATVAANEQAYCGLTAELPFAVFAERSDEDWVILPYIADWKEGDTPSEPQGMSSAAYSTVVFEYYTRDGVLLEGRPEKAGEYTMQAVAYAQDGAEIARKSVGFTVYGGVNGVMIALCCVLGALVCTLAVMLTVYLIRRKRGKDNGGAPDSEELPAEERAEEQPTEAAEEEEPAQTIEEEQPEEQADGQEDNSADGDGQE